jgi:hypothetical protein
MDDLEVPVSIKLRASASRFGRKEGETLSVPVTPGFRLTPAYASLSTRRLPVKLPPLGAIDDTFVVKLLPGQRVISLPQKAAGTSPFGSYEVTSEADESKVTVRSKVALTAVTVPPEQYPAWKQFCAEVDSALTPRLVLGSK